MRYFQNFDEYYAHARGKAEKLIPKVYKERKKEAQEEPKEEAKKAPKPRKKKGDE